MKKTKLSGSTKTKTKTTIGIDYSLTSPAVCLDNGNLMFFYLTNKKKWTGQMSEDIIGYEHKEWTDSIQRFTYISDFVFDIIGSLSILKFSLKVILLGQKVKVFFKSLKIVAYSNTDFYKKVTHIIPLYRVLLKKVLQEKVTPTKI